MPTSRIKAVVAEIMASPLVKGTPTERFCDLSEHQIWGHIDQIPVEDAGRIIGICDRPLNPKSILGDSMIGISSDMLVSGDTKILNLFDADWDNHPFFLVVEQTSMVGIVTPSDLNKLPVYAAIFDLIALLEDRLTKFLDRKPTNDMRLNIFSPRELGRTNKAFAALKRGGFDISRLQVLYLEEKLRLYLHEQPDRDLTNESIAAVTELRNKVTHQNPLVNSIDHIAGLGTILRLLLSIISALPAATEVP